MNTNYNGEVEKAVSIHGMDAWDALCARLAARL